MNKSAAIATTFNHIILDVSFYVVKTQLYIALGPLYPFNSLIPRKVGVI